MGCISLFLMYDSSLEEIRLIQERVKRYGVGGSWAGRGRGLAMVVPPLVF